MYVPSFGRNRSRAGFLDYQITEKPFPAANVDVGGVICDRHHHHHDHHGLVRNLNSSEKIRWFLENVSGKNVGDFNF